MMTDKPNCTRQIFILNFLRVFEIAYNSTVAMKELPYERSLVLSQTVLDSHPTAVLCNVTDQMEFPSRSTKYSTLEVLLLKSCAEVVIHLLKN